MQGPSLGMSLACIKGLVSRSQTLACYGAHLSNRQKPLSSMAGTVWAGLTFMKSSLVLLSPAMQGRG